MPYGSKKNLRIALRQDIFEAAVNYKADKDISMSQLIAMAPVLPLPSLHECE